MYKINRLNPIAKCGLDLLTDKYELVDDYAQAQGVLVRSASMHELELGENLEVVARAGAGVNNIPLDECAKRGIVVFNTPGANANGVKELVIAGLLLAARDITGGINWVKENKADENINKTVEKAKKAFAGGEIKGKKLGVIGLGAIGVQVANTAASLGMKVYGYDPYISVSGAWHLSYHVIPVKTIEELAEECDYITIHVPLMDATKGMLNKDVFDKMKDGSVVLNFSRDSLVNDEDIEAALKSGKIRKYVTDFPNAKTANMENVIAIPHLGASTAESEDNCAVMAVEEMMDYLENGNIRNSVNYPACDLGPVKSAARICVFGKNVPNIIAQLSSVFSAVGINIAAMANKSKGEYAYTLIDSDDKVTDEMIEKIKSIPDVFKVRVIQ